MQDVKHFINGRDLHGEYHMEDLDEQINDFLKEHPNYSVCTFSTIMGPAYKEAFVVFDVKEESKQKQEPKSEGFGKGEFNGGKGNRQNRWNEQPGKKQGS